MEWKKIAPWNWFREEEPSAGAMPTAARRDAYPDALAPMRSEMERIFNDTFRGTLPWVPGFPLRPNADISEGKKAYTVRLELPGVDLEAVSIEVEEHKLIVHAEKRQEKEDDDEGYHYVERSYGAMQRVLSLPDDADTENIEAKFKNGVLKLRIPKHAARASRGRSIAIQSG